MSALNLAGLPVDLRALGRWAAVRGFAEDEGRALHHLLAETFGKGQLQPFRLMAAPGAAHSSLYAYARADAPGLLQVARECALPDALAACDVAQLATKTMPESWKTGRRLAFDLRVRPTRRLHKPAGSLPKGAEVDAYLVEAMRRFPAGRPPLEERIAREEVYLRWLKERLQDAARVDAARIVSFERRKALRGATQREGPEVVWHGELTVLDGSVFSTRLASGVGRHAAYGFGMLLLRPAGLEDGYVGGTARP
jgi:CRISPR system Cascade subunit CasE